MSPRFDKVMGAMLFVQSKIYAPPRNKTVQIVPKRGVPFTFAYTTLDIILEMLKAPMTEAGLALINFYRPGAKGLEIYVRIVHAASQQWIESIVPMPPESADSAQGIGSATTYLRRYTICAMFNIASDEDTDAAAAINGGGAMVPATAEQAERLAGQQASDRFNRLVAECNGARSPQSLTRVLQTFDEGMQQFLAYRDDEARSSEWHTVSDLTTSAITRVHGAELGDLWRRMLVCTSSEQLAEMRAIHEQPDTKAAIATARTLSPENVGRIKGQLIGAAQRVERSAGAPPRVEPPAAAEPPVSEFSVLDEVGEVMGEPFTDPHRYVLAYIDQVRSCGNRDAVAEHNAEGLAWVRSQNPACWTLLQERLRELESPAEEAPRAPAPARIEPPLEQRDLVIPVATTRSGTPDLQGYLNAVQRALRDLDRREVLPWMHANQDTYGAFPNSTRLKVKAMLAECAQRLGVDVA